MAQPVALFRRFRAGPPPVNKGGWHRVTLQVQPVLLVHASPLSTRLPPALPLDAAPRLLRGGPQEVCSRRTRRR